MTDRFYVQPNLNRALSFAVAFIVCLTLAIGLYIVPSFSQALADESDSGVYAFVCQKDEDTIFVIKNGTDYPDQETYGTVSHAYTAATEELSSNTTGSFNKDWPWSESASEADIYVSSVTKVVVEGNVSLSRVSGMFAHFFQCKNFDLTGLDTTGVSQANNRAYVSMLYDIAKGETDDIVVKVGENWNLPTLGFSTAPAYAVLYVYTDDGTAYLQASAIPAGAGTYHTKQPAEIPSYNLEEYEVAISGTSFVFNGGAQPSISSITVVKKDDSSSVLSSNEYNLQYNFATKVIDGNGQESWTTGSTTGRSASVGGYAVRAIPRDGSYCEAGKFTSYTYYEITPECDLSAYYDTELSTPLSSALSVVDPYSFYVVCPSALETMDVVAKSSNVGIATVTSTWFSYDQDNHSVYKVTVTPVASGTATISVWGDTNSNYSDYYVGTAITEIPTTVTVRSSASFTPATGTPESIDLKANGGPTTVAVSYAGDETIAPSSFSVTSSDEGVATGSYDSATGTLTVTPHAASDEDVTITLKAAQTDSYTSAEYSLKVKVSKSAATLSVGKSALSLVIGDKEDVTVTFVSDASLAFSSSDETVAKATLSQDGKTLSVEALKIGTATITLSAEATETYGAPEPVTITVGVSDKPAATLSVGKSALDLAVGGKEDVTVSCSSDGKVTAISSDETVAKATLSQDGKTLSVEALKIGTATITLTAEATDDYGAPEPVTITVGVIDKPDGNIDVDAELELTVGDAPLTVNLGYTGDGELSVTNTDDTVATVSLSGTTLTVTPVAPGTTTVTISSEEGEQYGAADPVTIAVTVKAATPGEKPVVKLTPLYLTEGSKISGAVTLKDAEDNPIAGTVTVSSSDESVARATYDSETGKFTVEGIAVGTATITFASDDAASDYTIEITVTRAPQKVSVNLIDEYKTGVSANTDKFDLPNASSEDEVNLVVEEVTRGEAYDALIAKKGEGEFSGVYKITLLFNGTEVHDGFGSITLTFPVDEKYNGQQVTVWHLHENGSITSELVTVTDGKATITVDDLSTFAIEVAGEQDVVTGSTDDGTTQAGGDAGMAKTGDATATTAALAFIAAVLGSAACAVSYRRSRMERSVTEKP